MSPRRSSRAKTSQPTSVTQHTNSSSSSVSSGRADRRSRSNNKLPSPRSSIAPRSPSSEDCQTSSKPQARRTRSSQELPKIEADDVQEDEDLDEEDGDEEDEEEVTRCVCGQQEYPGMPAAAPRSNGEPDDINPWAALQEDTGGMFIQCDVCKVWQHGGCVGIMDEATSPEEYFCEQCRKDLHTITNTATGQKYSIYLPVQEASPPQSPESPVPQESVASKPKESRSSRLNPEGTAGKRRSTMNSRDAAYYEAEQLRRAIEESKKEGATATGSGSRKAKRNRNGSDQRKDSNKRQRTESGSSDSSNDKRATRDEAEDGTEDINTMVSSSGKGSRGAPARNHRNKELREQEGERDKDRLDAASRRKGRAEKRCGDESDPSEEPLRRITSLKGADKISAETLLALPVPPAPKASHHRKTGRPPARRSRVGRNQYTRDRDRPDTPRNPQDATSPTHSHSSKEGHASPMVNGHNHEPGKSSKSRHMNPGRSSMNDMKRRVAGILEFISRTQVEMAAEVPFVPAFNTASSSKTPTARAPVTPPNEERNSKDGNEAQTAERQQNIIGALAADVDFEQFKNLGSLEMMEALTRKLMKWQGEFGKYGEK